MEVTGNTIRNAVISKLLEVFPDVYVYDESRTDVKYPHFFVYQISLLCNRERKDYNLLTYSIDVRYRSKADPTLNLELQQELDTIGIELLHNFNIIECGEDKIRCSEKNIEKEDGILHFYFNIVILEKEINIDDNVKKQGKLELNFDTRIRNKT